MNRKTLVFSLICVVGLLLVAWEAHPYPKGVWGFFENNAWGDFCEQTFGPGGR